MSELDDLKLELAYRDLEVELMYLRQGNLLTEEQEESILEKMTDIWYNLSDEATERDKIRTPKLTGWEYPWVKELHAENKELIKRLDKIEYFVASNVDPEDWDEDDLGEWDRIHRKHFPENYPRNKD